MAMKTYYIRTFGCQMNERDSERMAALLEGMGYVASETGEVADVMIVNTCSVRAKPEHKVYSELGRYRKIKRRRENLVLVVAGCVAQQEGEEFLRRAPHLDIVLGTRVLSRLPDYIEAALEDGRRICDIGMKNITRGSLFGAERPRPDSPSAFVVAMTGCSNACSYCVVPRLRGPAVSRPTQEIIDEVRELAGAGVPEVTLIGQNVNIYGQDFHGAGCDFPELLRMVSRVDGIKRVRFVTSHPKDFSDKLIEETAANPKVCEYLHLPVQAGSDKVLERMKRGYTRTKYLGLIDRIREAVPDVALSADFIVGFPGETEDDFQQTLDLVRQVRYHNIYSFCYSPRPHTAAERMKPDVPQEERARRLHVLQRLQDEITSEIMKSYEGISREVLLEGPSKTDPQRTTGRTRCNLPVHIPGVLSPGEVVTVSITRALRHSLEGEESHDRRKEK